MIRFVSNVVRNVKNINTHLYNHASNLFTGSRLSPIIPNLNSVNKFNLQSVREMASKKHKKIIKLAKGYRGRANRCYSVAWHRVLKAHQYAYRDRKVKKRDARKLWIMRINAATRMYNVPYNIFINNLLKANIKLNRKMLSDLAVYEPKSFKAVLEISKKCSELNAKQSKESSETNKP